MLAVNIRPHLITFLYNEMQGEVRADVDGKKAKLINISKSSLLGRLLEEFKQFAGQQLKPTNRFSIFLRITEHSASGGFHEVIRNEKSKKNIYKVLQLQPGHIRIINDLLEQQFRLSVVEFIKGYTSGSSSLNAVSTAINKFMIAHKLYDTEIDPESLRRMYYNALKKNHCLSKIHNQTSVRTVYYHSA